MKTVGNELLLHNPDKVEVETGVHDGKDDLLNSIPDIVEVNPLLANLQASWDPDIKDTDVDGQEDEEAKPFELGGVGSNNH